MKIIDTSQFTSTLRKLKSSNEAIIFESVNEDLTLMLRPDTENADDNLIAFELVIVYDSEDDTRGQIAKLLRLEHLGYFEDDDESSYVIETFAFPADPADDSDAVRDAIKKLEWTFRLRICGCSKYLVKSSEDDVCYYCQITARREDMEPTTCPICHADSAKISFSPRPCCGVNMHDSCLRKWYEKDPGRSCPMCRHSEAAAQPVN